MEQQSVDKIIEATHWPRVMAATALGMLALFLLVGTAGELRGYRYIGAGITPTDTIDVSGEGEVFAVPDTAEFSFTVQETASDVATAQANATKKSNDIIDYLKQQGIADKDIQTTDYNVNPHYEYQNAVCPLQAGASGGSSGGGVASPNVIIGTPIYCPPGKQTITGYDVSQTVDVKVHDTSKAGTLLSGVGTRGVSTVSGLTFTVADEDALQAQARDKAIADAQAKAQALAKSLGVSLVGIVNYNENTGGSPVPMFAKAPGGAALETAAPAPEIPTGQNKITSDVSITYEIR